MGGIAMAMPPIAVSVMSVSGHGEADRRWL